VNFWIPAQKALFLPAEIIFGHFSHQVFQKKPVKNINDKNYEQETQNKKCYFLRNYAFLGIWNNKKRVFQRRKTRYKRNSVYYFN
jgi:hypothetical protein